MKKNIFLTLTAVVIILTISACTSMFPVSDAGSFPGDSANYEVLGRVELETGATKSGYNKLYAAAKKLYPDCDDVVNVKIDRKKTVFLIFVFEKYEMSGIAIEYTKKEVKTDASSKISETTSSAETESETSTKTVSRARQSRRNR